MEIIAHIETDFPEKFGIPRQSGLVDNLSRIVFEPKFRDINAFRGIEGYSHLWIIWQFSEAVRDNFSPTVHPPRLGGNVQMGVFATRSPFRPNSLGLSSVKLEKLETDEKNGPVLYVSGADMLNNTPIYDVKPYLAYTDSHPDAVCGFSDDVADYKLNVCFPKELLKKLPEEKRSAAIGILEQDPRPSYINDSERIYGVAFSGQNIRFKVDGENLTVTEVDEYKA
jgi:tRNA-Thr(GGU) m(6)t(6)A37 methyltransferase TsaA